MTQEIAKGAAEVIQALMKAQGLNQSDLARKAGVSRQYVSQSFSDPTVGSLGTMENFARAMGHTLISSTAIPTEEPLPLYKSGHRKKKGKEAKKKK